MTDVASTVVPLLTTRIQMSSCKTYLTIRYTTQSDNICTEEDLLCFRISNELDLLYLTQSRELLHGRRCSSNSRVILNIKNSAVATLCSQTTHPWKMISWGPVLVIKVICVQLRHPLIDVASTTGPLLTTEVQESFLSDCSNY